MSLGNILGQILQEGGLGGQTQTRQRVGDTARNLDAGGGGEGIFAQIQNALGNAGQPGGFGERAQDFARDKQVGNLSGAAVGGIGALAGAVLGGGLGGAAKGGAMAVLGTLALQAIQRARANSAHANPDGGAQFDQAEVKSLVSPEGERLALRAMISAAKADGQVDQQEMQKIVGKLGSEVSAEEKSFVMDEMNAPLDVNGLASGVRNPAQAAQVYAASLLAIDVDSDRERQYLRDLAQALRLDAATIQQLHQLTTVPA